MALPFSKEEIEELKKLGVRDIKDVDMRDIVNKIQTSKNVAETISKMQKTANVIDIELEIKKHMMEIAKSSKKSLLEIIDAVTNEQLKAYLKVRFDLIVSDKEIDLYINNIKKREKKNE